MSQTPAPANPVAEAMRARLIAAFAPSELELLDESARHAGHAGHNPAGESHFRLKIRAAAFNGKNRVQRQRMVHEILARELQGRVHALSMTVLGTEEGNI